VTEALDALRDEFRDWIAEHRKGDFASYADHAMVGTQEIPYEVSIAWERELARGGWVGLGIPSGFGGRGLSIAGQLAFFEEYARSGAMRRMPTIGESLLAPTLLHAGSPALQQRFLPPIVEASELWCQGYSEPGAGSDLASLRTRATRDGDQWVITGQKVWTTWAHLADWCFVLTRTGDEAERHRSLTYLIVPMHQPGIEVRTIVQATGETEYCEVFFDGAVTAASNVVGTVGGGWGVAMATLGFERGTGAMGMQLSFEREFEGLRQMAQARRVPLDPALRQALVQSWIELRLMRATLDRSLPAIVAGRPGPEASISKLAWSSWYQRFGELAMRVRGTASLISEEEPPSEGTSRTPLDNVQRAFLFGRAVTIYAGSNEIQRTIVGERTLGLPR
jgi:alkylation response protein AidB-like acyl-CoA dehydrogenase